MAAKRLDVVLRIAQEITALEQKVDAKKAELRKFLAGREKPRDKVARIARKGIVPLMPMGGTLKIVADAFEPGREMTFREIAKKTGINPNTVSARLNDLLRGGIVEHGSIKGMWKLA